MPQYDDDEQIGTGNIQIIKANIQIQNNQQAFVNWFSIILKMKKQLPKPKTTKTLSKTNTINKDRNQRSYKDLPTFENNLHYENLQYALQQQIATRQAAQIQLFQMIRHIQATKKSKVPVKYQKLTTKKFYSPCKGNPNMPKENNGQNLMNQAITKDIHTLEEHREADLVLINAKFQQIYQQISALTQSFSSFKESVLEINQGRAQIREKQPQYFHQLLSDAKQEIFMKLSQQIKQESLKIATDTHNNIELQLKQINISNQQQLNQLQNCMKEQITVITQRLDETIHMQTNQLQDHDQALNKLVHQISNCKEAANTEKTYYTEAISKITEKLNILKQQTELTIKQINQDTKISQQKLLEQVMRKIKEEMSTLQSITSRLNEEYHSKIDNIGAIINNNKDILANLENMVDHKFDWLEKQLMNVSSTVIETKQSIESAFYGDIKSREKCSSSTVSIEISSSNFTTPNQNRQKHGNWYIKQTIDGILKRISSLETSFQLVFEQYMQKPVI